MNPMDVVLVEAKKKMYQRISKPGNTSVPWVDFSTEYLEKRLDDEFHEWKVSGDSEELLDIINMAVFVGLSRCHDDNQDNPNWENHILNQRRRRIERQIIKLQEAIEYSKTQYWDVTDWQYQLSRLKNELTVIHDRLTHVIVKPPEANSPGEGI